jgi:hypothetical protein
MTTTIAAPTRTATTNWDRIAGIGAITFAAVATAANLLIPDPLDFDASGTDVVSWVHEHHAALALTVMPFAIAMVALMLYAAGFWNRARRTGDETTRVFATVGMLGMLMIGALFGVVEVGRLTLLALNGSGADPSLFQFAWHIETAAFTLNLVGVALALFGVTGAAVRMGLAPGWYKPVSIVGLLCGVAAAMQAPVVFNGTQGWQIGFVPFVAWVLLDVIVGTRMARQP